MNRRSLAVSLVLVLLAFSLGWSLSSYAQSGSPEIKPSGISGFPWVNGSSFKLNKDLYYGAYNRTPVVKYPEKAASIIVWKDGSTIYAQWGNNASILTSGTDAYAVFNLCKNTLGVSGGTIFVKRGNYVFSDTFVINITLNLVGEGKTKTRLQGNFSSPSDLIEVTGENVLISNLQLSRVGSSGRYGLYLNGARRMTIRDVEIYNQISDGCAIIDSWDLTFDRVRFTTNGQDGCRVLTSAVVPSEITFYSCQFDENGRYGFSNDWPIHTISFYGGYFYNNNDTGIYTGSIRALKLDNVQIESNGGYGVFWNNPNGQIDTCHILGNVNHAIYVFGGRLVLESTYIKDTASGKKDLYVESGATVYLQRGYLDFSKVVNYGVLITEERNEGVVTNTTSTTFVFNHGLATTPTFVSASFNTTSITGWTWVANSTQVTITVSPALTAPAKCYWAARYTP